MFIFVFRFLPSFLFLFLYSYAFIDIYLVIMFSYCVPSASAVRSIDGYAAYAVQTNRKTVDSKHWFSFIFHLKTVVQRRKSNNEYTFNYVEPSRFRTIFIMSSLQSGSSVGDIGGWMAFRYSMWVFRTNAIFIIFLFTSECLFRSFIRSSALLLSLRSQCECRRTSARAHTHITLCAHFIEWLCLLCCETIVGKYHDFWILYIKQCQNDHLSWYPHYSIKGIFSLPTRI